MDERVRARRRTVGRERGRRRITVVAVVAVLIACAAVFLWLRSSDVFAVKRVVATSTNHVTPEEIDRATGSARGVSLLRLSLGEIEAELSALPYVRTVEVRRGFPNTLVVELTEYEPVARLRAGAAKDTWLVAENGRVLEEGSEASLPLVISQADFSHVPGEHLPGSAMGALALAVLLTRDDRVEDLPPVDHIVVASGGDLILVLEGGAEVRLGEPKELEQKLMVAAPRIDQCLRDGRTLAYVDVRVPDRVAVKAE